MNRQLNFVLNDEKKQTKSQQHMAFIKDITYNEAEIRFTKGTASHKALRWAYHVAKGKVIAPNIGQFQWESDARKSIVTVVNSKNHIQVTIKAA